MDEPDNVFLEKMKEHILRLDLEKTRNFRHLMNELGYDIDDKKVSFDLKKVLGAKGKLLKCKYCGRQFTRAYGDHRSVCCSELCHKRYIARQRNKNPDKEYAPYELVPNCLICGKSLKGKRPHAKTCSTKCRLKLNRQNKN
jgi:hypothetical protein